jgi:transporter family-2 protein
MEVGMTDTVVIIIIGLIGGVAVGLQSPLAGALGQRLGGTSSSFIVHLGGMVLSAILLVVRGGENIKDSNRMPWYMLGAGIFGVILYQTISVTLPRLGSTLMVTLIIIGQLMVGVLIDHFGWLGVTQHPITLTRALGVLVLLGGGYLISR